MRTFSAQVAPDAVVVCGRCAVWLAVGHLPVDGPEVLLACSSCGAVNDPRGATPIPDDTGASAAPGALTVAEIWAKAAVERVHSLAAQEQRWPWRAGGTV